MATQVYTWSNAPLQPAYDVRAARSIAVKLPASVTYTKGTILGELTGNDETQTVTIDATGGTFMLTLGGQQTATVAYNATAATLQTALEALSTIGAGNVSVAKLRSRWTLTLAAGTDGGTFQIRVTAGGVTRTTTALAFNADTAAVDAAVEALSNVGTAGVVATVAGEVITLVFPTSLGDVQVEVANDTTNDGGVWEGGVVVTETNLGGVYAVTFVNDLGKSNVAAMTSDATALTGGAGTATVATLTAGSAGTLGTFKKVVDTATDGSQVPRALLMHDVVTDASGNIFLGGSTSSEHGESSLVTPVWISGYFRCEDCTDLTTSRLAQMGRLIHGTVASGVFAIGAV